MEVNVKRLLIYCCFLDVNIGRLIIRYALHIGLLYVVGVCRIVIMCFY